MSRFSARAVVDGAVRCWGLNYDGNLGSGNTSTLLNGPGESASTVDIGPAIAVTVGDTFRCALVSGAVHCWGKGSAGQLGNEATSTLMGQGVDGTSTPDLGPNGVIAIEAGFDYICALTGGAQVRCWGSNGSGVLGHGGTDPLGGTVGDMPPPITNLMLVEGSVCSTTAQCFSASCAAGVCLP